MQTLQQLRDSELKTIIKNFQDQNGKPFTLQDLLNELRLQHKFFAILINGKSIRDLNMEISLTDDIVILPKIAGGH
jgi:sulfur carrier protein ThiS